MQARTLLSVAEPDVEAEEGTRTLVRQILGAISQYEAWLVSARLRAGREMKRAKGGYSAGRPRYGFRASGRALVPVVEEQAVINRAKALRRQGMSLRQVASRLTDEGHRPRSGRSWHPATVSRIVATERHA